MLTFKDYVICFLLAVVETAMCFAASCVIVGTAIAIAVWVL